MAKIFQLPNNQPLKTGNVSSLNIASAEDVKKAHIAALHKAHEFYIWLGEHVDEKETLSLLLEFAGGAVYCHAEMAEHMKAALASGDPALIRQAAEHWIAFDLLEKVETNGTQGI